MHLARRFGTLLAAVALSLSATAAVAQNNPALPYVEAVRQALEGRIGMDVAYAAIREHPDDAAGGFSTWFEANAPAMPPSLLYAYAGRRFAVDRPAGARWFLAARTRMFYDAFRCVDPTVFEHIGYMDALFDDVVAYLQANPTEGAAAGRWAITWDESHPTAERPDDLLAFCLTGVRGRELAVEQGLLEQGEIDGDGGETALLRIPLPTVDDPGEWVVPAARHAALRAEARAVTGRVVAGLEAN